MLLENIRALEIRYPKMVEKASKAFVDYKQYKLVETRNQDITVEIDKIQKKYFLHSKYNPRKEAEVFINQYICNEDTNYIVIGFGLGYHLEALLDKITTRSNVYVFEGNSAIFKIAIERRNLTDVLSDERVHLFVQDNPRVYIEEMTRTISTVDGQMILHKSSVEALPSNFEQVKFILEEFKMHQQSFLSSRALLAENFRENLKHYDACVDILFNQYCNVPLILVSAGPSLDKNKHILKQLRGKAIILAVGKAARTLINVDVRPDILIITDPSRKIYKQINGLELDIPLIALSTCGQEVLKYYKGFKYIALQKGFDLAEQYAERNKKRLIQTGGSVATAALDIAIQMGCNPIVFIGQDLAYTDGKSHCSEASFKAVNSSLLRSISGYNVEEVYTTKALHSYLRWIERRIKNTNGVHFINATEGGARIEGTQQLSLVEVANGLSQQQFII